MTSAQPWALQPALPATHMLCCAAGFHRHAQDARALAQGLRHDFGLSAAQITLLRPADAEPGRYSQLSRRWGRRAAPAVGASQRGREWAVMLVAAFGVGMPGLLLAAGGLASAGSTAGLPSALALVCMAMMLLAVAAALALAAGPRPALHRFDRVLQRTLRRGDWAVVVHDLPASLQADVATALRHNSRCWCAQARRRSV